MIVRTYGRRRGGASISTTARYGGSSYSDNEGAAVENSQESSQDVFNFGYSSSPQDWPPSSSDPYGSSQELTILPPRKTHFDGDNNEVLGEKKQKSLGVFDFNEEDEPYYPNYSYPSSQELTGFPLRNGGDRRWKKPKKVKVADELKELTISSPEKGGSRDSDDGFFWKSRGTDTYGSGSSQELSQELSGFNVGKTKNGKSNGGLGKKKKKKVKKCKMKKDMAMELETRHVVVNTTTLMETQEFGEMMEHVDEVNFALDGLKKGQPPRIRRASLLSLLSICATAQQRRLLRAHGMAKTIIDAVLALSFDDSPSNLAAAAIFYVLTSDGQDDNLLDSPTCIRFLRNLLKPLASDASKPKASSIGSKLLAIRVDADVPQEPGKGFDLTSRGIMLKVQEILVSCKETTKLRKENDDRNMKHELNPKWISLLTMEKACVSTISIEDTSGTVRKTRGNFKEKLREHGGLDAVFEVARDCHSVMEEWLGRRPSSILNSSDHVGLESLSLLLKCLKIMENATFLSKDNQNHLLDMKADTNTQNSPRSFIKLILSSIKILSGVSLARNRSGSSQDGIIHDTSFASELLSREDNIAESNEILSIASSARCCTMEWTSLEKSYNVLQNNDLLASDQPGFLKASSQATTTSDSDPRWSKSGIFSSASGSCSGTLGNSSTSNDSRKNFSGDNKYKVIEATNCDVMEDSQDPFAFHEDDFEPSKWDLLSGSQMVSQTQSSRSPFCENGGGSQPSLILSQQELCGMDYHSSEVSCSSVSDEEKSNLLADCLLTSVKVLMNLTNDNPVGCQQIAAYGGLEILSSLIAGHFPSFVAAMPPSDQRENISASKSVIAVDHQNDLHLSDHELDFLVAILGLLVNLVEKDGRNRSRLAAASVSLPSLEGFDEVQKDVIPLFCSIFLSNQGASEPVGEGKCFDWDDEDALLQGEKEAEKMIVEAYAALLLAFLSTESKSTRNAIAECLPRRNLAILVPVLERFVEFHLTLNMITPETHSAVLEVIESCRIL